MQILSKYRLSAVRVSPYTKAWEGYRKEKVNKIFELVREVNAPDALYTLLRKNNNLLQIGKNIYVTVFYVSDEYLDSTHIDSQYRDQALKELNGLYFLAYIIGFKSKVLSRKGSKNFYTFTLEDLPIHGCPFHLIKKWGSKTYKGAVDLIPGSEMQDILQQYYNFAHRQIRD